MRGGVVISHYRTLSMCIAWCLGVRVLASFNRLSNEQGVSHCSDAGGPPGYYRVLNKRPRIPPCLHSAAAATAALDSALPERAHARA